MTNLQNLVRHCANKWNHDTSQMDGFHSITVCVLVADCSMLPCCVLFFIVGALFMWLKLLSLFHGILTSKSLPQRYSQLTPENDITQHPTYFLEGLFIFQPSERETNWATKKNPHYFPLYWLFNRHPYSSLFNNAYITGEFFIPPFFPQPTR